MKHYDLFLLEPISPEVQALFPENCHSGFAGMDLESALAKELHMKVRAAGGQAYVVPCEYRDLPLQPEPDLDTIRQLFGPEFAIARGNVLAIGGTPLWRTFRAIINDEHDEHILIDRIDGHIWTAQDAERYLLQWESDAEFQLATLDLTLASSFNEKCSAANAMIATKHRSVPLLLKIELEQTTDNRYKEYLSFALEELRKNEHVRES